MNVDIFSLIISKIDPKDTKTFSALRLTCKTSWKAYVKHSRKLLKEYNEQQLYVYWKALDGWGGYYQGEYHVSKHKPSQREIDPFENSRLVFISTRQELDKQRSEKYTCTDTCDFLFSY